MKVGPRTRVAFTLLALAAMDVPAAAQDDTEVYTLYRNSVTDVTMRIHVASFDSADGKQYNYENCIGAADLFQGQDGLQVRFWRAWPV